LTGLFSRESLVLNPLCESRAGSNESNSASICEGILWAEEGDFAASCYCSVGQTATELIDSLLSKACSNLATRALQGGNVGVGVDFGHFVAPIKSLKTAKGTAGLILAALKGVESLDQTLSWVIGAILLAALNALDFLLGKISISVDNSAVIGAFTHIFRAFLKSVIFIKAITIVNDAFLFASKLSEFISHHYTILVEVLCVLFILFLDLDTLETVESAGSLILSAFNRVKGLNHALCRLNTAVLLANTNILLHLNCFKVMLMMVVPFSLNAWIKIRF
jgi:hypothetical protein